MAQTKRKRRSKHRGNAAGVVEARGRTSTTRGGATTKQTAGQRGAHRLDQPPTWRGAANRAAVITALAVALFVLVLKAPVVQMFSIAVPMFVIYTAVNYQTDRFIYNRRQAKKTSGKR